MPRRIFRVLMFLGMGGGLVAGAARPVAADIVYDQPAAFPSTGSFNGAWTSYDFPSGTSYHVFDNFRLTSTAQVNQVNWQGIFYDYVTPGNNPATPNTNAFQITFYSDSKGLPGAPILSETVSGANLTSTSVGTGTIIGATVPAFNEQATLPTAFAALANQTYWVSIISKSASEDPLWAWTGGISGLDHATLQQDTSGTYFLRPNDRALTLSGNPAAIPEPSSIAILSIGLSGLWIARRRARAK